MTESESNKDVANGVLEGDGTEYSKEGIEGPDIRIDEANQEIAAVLWRSYRYSPSKVRPLIRELPLSMQSLAIEQSQIAAQERRNHMSSCIAIRRNEW